MPTAIRVVNCIADLDDFGDALTWVGQATFSDNVLQADAKYILADQIRARDGDGLKLYDDGGNGIFVEDGGFAGFGIANPVSPIHVYEDTAVADATAGLTVEQDGAGDAVLQLLLTGGQRWVLGTDNSDSDSFKVAQTADLNSSAFFIIEVGGNIGAGALAPTAPYGSFHIKQAASGAASAHASGDNLIVEDSTDCGISILSPDTTSGHVMFGDNGSTFIGGIEYDHVTDSLILNASGTDRVTVDSTGVGIGVAPGTLLEMAGAAPYFTLWNTAEEDAEGGRESRLIFEGEQTGGEHTTLALIQASHDGIGDDEKGDLIFKANAGSDGNSPAEGGRLASSGYWGFGATDPAAQVHVRTGATGALGIFEGSSDERLTIYQQASDDWRIYVYDSGDVAYRNLHLGGTGQALTLLSDGKAGFGTTSPGTLVELSSTAPYLTFWNTTEEDIEGGRATQLIFEGEQSGGEHTTLAIIQASHDGVADDQKGDLIFKTNDGSDGDTPTEQLRIDSAGLATFVGDISLATGKGIIHADGVAAGKVLIADGTSYVPDDLPGSFSGFANPSASVGLAAVNGVATTAMRSDGAPALDVNIAPTWTAAHAFNENITQADAKYISTDQIRARDADGLKLYDDGGLGIFVEDGGQVGINIAAPAGQCHIDQSATDGAVPVVVLDQADIDQPAVKIIGTAEVGSADRTLVAASDFTTPGAIVAWEMVYVEDVGDRFTDAKYYRPLYAIPTA